MAPLGGDLVRDLVAGDRAVGLHEVVHGEVDPVEAAAGDGQLAGHGGAGRHDHGVEAGLELVPGQVDADLHAGAEPGALGLHLRQAPVQDVLLQLEVRDAQPQQAAEALVALVDHHGEAGAGELLRRGQSRRARADDGHGVAVQAGRHDRLEPVVVEDLLRDRHLGLLDGDRGLVDAQGAGVLARGGADPPGDLGEVVGRVQSRGGLGPASPPDQVVPLRDEVAQRAPGVAERDAAVHAPAGLGAHDRLVLADVHVLEVHDAHRHRTRGALDALPVLQESARISHGSPPAVGPRRPPRPGRVPRPSRPDGCAARGRTAGAGRS